VPLALRMERLHTLLRRRGEVTPIASIMGR
jgi:hypothetical protein